MSRLASFLSARALSLAALMSVVSAAETSTPNRFGNVVPQQYALHFSRESAVVRKAADDEYRKFLGRIRDEAGQASLCTLLQTDDLSTEVGKKLNDLLMLRADAKSVAEQIRRCAHDAAGGDEGIPLVLDEVTVWRKDDIVAALKAKGPFDGLSLAEDGKNIDFAFSAETGGKPLGINVIIPVADWETPNVARTVRSRLAVFETVYRDYHKVNRLLPAQHALRLAILHHLDARSYAVAPPRWFIEATATVGSFSILRDLLGTNEAIMAYNAAFGQPDVVRQAGKVHIAAIYGHLNETSDLPQLVAANLVLMHAVEKHRIVVVPQIYDRLTSRALGSAPSFGEVYEAVVKERVPDVPPLGPQT